MVLHLNSYTFSKIVWKLTASALEGFSLGNNLSKHLAYFHFFIAQSVSSRDCFLGIRSLSTSLYKYLALLEILEMSHTRSVADEVMTSSAFIVVDII